ncbi:MAG: hypothetical protein ACQES9_10560 [Myxococcota bacterium]
MVIFIFSSLLLLGSPQIMPSNPTTDASSTSADPATPDVSSENAKEPEKTNSGVGSASSAPAKSTPAKPKPEPNKKKDTQKNEIAKSFSIGAEIFFNYGITYNKNNDHQSNSWSISRSELKFGFTPSTNFSFFATTDIIDQDIDMVSEHGNFMRLKYGWAELKNLFFLPGKMYLAGGQVENFFKKQRNQATGLRFVMSSPITRYYLVPGADLGIWLKGSIINDTIFLSAGISNGNQITSNRDNNKQKVFDLGVSYKIPGHLKMKLGGYIRLAVDENEVNPDENSISNTFGVSFDLNQDLYQAGLEFLFHTYNDYLSGNEEIRHNLYVMSLYGKFSPFEKLFAFGRFDLLNYSHGTMSDDNFEANGNTIVFGVGYKLAKGLTLAVDLQAENWNSDNINKKNFKKYSDVASIESYPPQWDGNKTIFVHTRFDY